MVFMAIPAPGQKETPISPRGEDFLGAYSSLCLRLFCPGDLRGCWGDGGKSPEGPACDEHLAPTGQEPSVTAITIWSISHLAGDRRSGDLVTLTVEIVSGLDRWKRGSTAMNKLLILTALGLFLAVHVAVALLTVWAFFSSGLPIAGLPK
jgi:hypothetical protein